MRTTGASPDIDGVAEASAPSRCGIRVSWRRAAKFLPMIEERRLAVDEFFDWLGRQEGLHELVDGRIVPHPDYVTPSEFAAPRSCTGSSLRT